ncbi:alpha/beta hydrolase [Blastococcus sp. Marseille-P5729]|uniref:alpha/beta hydrolase n=1 Tax=Blastococcus sp. Marseille-P5729 TaxID=2086582 RepID=UPI000D0EF9B8|nr:alpha/beta hydrolase [Blastococcus sp. Marseille-P5729]
MQLLFLHGAGGYEDDQALATRLGAAAGVQPRMPRVPDENMSYEGWAVPIRAALGDLGPEDLVVGHSFGGSVLLKVLAERAWPLTRAILLAVPCWRPEGWDQSEYAFDGAEPPQTLVLHQCRDDEVVPFEHLALNAAALPRARVVEHAHGGHQLDEVDADALLSSR